MKTLHSTRTRILLVALLATVLGSVPAAGQDDQADRPKEGPRSGDPNATLDKMPDGGKNLSVDQVVRWTNYRSYYQGHSGRADVQMDIVDGRGQKRTRQFTILRRDDQPSTKTTMVQIVVDWAGASPKDVESQVVRPIEEAVKPVDGVKSVSSDSRAARAVIRAVSDEKAKPKAFVEAVSEAVAGAKSGLPDACGEPNVLRVQPDHAFTGEQKYYVYFRKPADVAKTVFLVWKHLGENDDRWMYFPDLDLVKRISAADKRTSFVGSHFLYEDVSGRNIDLDKHELIDTNKTYFVLKNTPRKPKDVEFGHYVMYVHRKTFLVVQTTYYDKQGKAYRKYTTKAVKTIDGYPTVVKSRMKDLKTGGYTDLSYTGVNYNVGLPEDIFDKRYLRRPPRKHLKSE